MIIWIIFIIVVHPMIIWIIFIIVPRPMIIWIKKPANDGETAKLVKSSRVGWDRNLLNIHPTVIQCGGGLYWCQIYWTRQSSFCFRSNSHTVQRIILMPDIFNLRMTYFDGYLWQTYPSNSHTVRRIILMPDILNSQMELKENSLFSILMPAFFNLRMSFEHKI